MASVTVQMGRGLFLSTPTAAPSGSPITFGWTTAEFPASGAATLHDPITLLLKFLISSGTGNNYSGSGTNYDDWEQGVGLGIPQEQIDISGFEAIRDGYDFDTAVKFALFSRNAMPAKKTLEKELCRPFGLYLTTSNTGLITLKRPKNPEKFHICDNNNNVKVKVASGGTTYSATLSTGIYNPTEMAAEVQAQLRAATSDTSWTVSWDSGTYKLSITHTGAADWDLIASDNDGWNELGFTSTTTGQSDGVALAADEARAQFSGTTLTADDMWDIRMQDSRDDQITSVLYMYDWTPGGSVASGQMVMGVEDEGYRRQRWYISAEDVNLGDQLQDRAYVIKSKGLVSIGSTYQSVPWSYYTEPSSGCTPELQEPTGSGVNTDSMTMLFPAMLLDRYRQPPMRFSAKLKYEHNTLELGDNVQVTYDKAGVFMDRELNADTISGRTFEIVKLTPHYRRGYVEAHFVGHRSPSTPSVSVTARGN